MRTKLWLILSVLAASTAISGCVPLVIGAGGAVIADEVMEQEGGGDGLF